MLFSTDSRRFRTLILALAALLLCAAISHAQLPAPPVTTEDALHEMLAQAGVVFTGQVTAIRHTGSILEVDFAIDEAILGVTSSTTYTLHEWTGPAPAASHQFEIGRRYLMFLHARGPGGLSSPVGGPDGAIPIVPGNEAASPNTPDVLGFAAQAALAQTATPASATPASTRAHTNFRLSTSEDSAALASSTVDLRWIATRVLTPTEYATTTATPAAARPIIARGNMVSPGTHLIHFAVQSATNQLAAEPSSATPSVEPPASAANYSSVLPLLRAWGEEARAAR